MTGEEKKEGEEARQDTLPQNFRTFFPKFGALACANLRFRLQSNKNDGQAKSELFTNPVRKVFQKNRMVEFYKLVWSENGWIPVNIGN